VRVQDRTAKSRALGRVLLASVALALMYSAIDRIWLWGAGKLLYSGWTWDDPARTYAGQALALAERSRARERALGAQSPQIAFRLGVEYGYLSERVGSAESSWPDPSLPELHRYATMLGLDSIKPLPLAPERSFLARTARFEDDIGGVAAKVEEATSPRLRHLFLLGAHAGSELARLATSRDPIPAPVDPIGMHGALAGVPKPLWRALMRVSERSKAVALAEYRAAVAALDEYLGAAAPIAAVRASAPTSTPGTRTECSADKRFGFDALQTL